MSVDFKFEGSESELSGNATYTLSGASVTINVKSFPDARALWQFMDRVYLRGRQDGIQLLTSKIKAVTSQVY